MSLLATCPHCGLSDPEASHDCKTYPVTLKRRALADRHPESKSEIEDLQRQLLAAKQEAGQWRTKYEHLDQVYNKLADQWNVSQSLNKLDNRNIQRAEGAGEMARKLAEVLLGVAYQKDTREILRKILEDLDAPGGQDVEVSQGLVVTRRVK